jgi:hypothetical protein
MELKVLTGSGVFCLALLILLLASCTPTPEGPPPPVIYPSVCGDGVCSGNELGACDIDCNTANQSEQQPVVTTPSDVMAELRGRTKVYTPEERMNQTNTVVVSDDKINVESFASYVPQAGFIIASRYNLLSLGENLSSVVAGLSQFQLREILRGGVLRSSTEAFGPRAAGYAEFIKLRSGKVLFGFDEDTNTISTYLSYKDGEPILEYIVELQGGIFKFFEGEKINFLGHDYTIDKVTNNSMRLVGLSTPDAIMFRNSRGAIVNNEDIFEDTLNVTFAQDKLRIILSADKDINILPGKTLRNYLSRPQVLLTNRLDIGYDGLTDVPVYDIKLDRVSEKYKLTFTTNKNITYNLPFAYLDPLRLGDKETNLIYKEGTGSSDYTIKKKDYFIISNNRRFNGLTNVIRLISVDYENHLLTFEDPSLEKFMIYFEGTPGVNATGDLIVDRVKHKVYVSKNSTISVDLDGNGRINEDIVPIITAGNAIIRINKAYANEINLSIITPKEMRENSSSDLEVNMLLRPAGIKISSDDLEMLSEPSSGLLVGMNNYGALFVLKGDVDEDGQNGEDLLVKYPLVQRFADVVVKAYE